jgi:hypothetical protein
VVMLFHPLPHEGMRHEQGRGYAGGRGLQGVALSDEGGFRAVLERALQAVLEAEMSEALQAEKGERTRGRLGYRSGYYERKLVTRVAAPPATPPPPC